VWQGRVGIWRRIFGVVEGLEVWDGFGFGESCEEAERTWARADVVWVVTQVIAKQLEREDEASYKAASSQSGLF